MSKTLMDKTPKPMMLKHPDGYIGEVEMDEVADILSGRVIGIRDGITFEGKTPKEVRNAFYEAVEAYKALCEREGKEPERSFSGNIPFRTTPKMHEDIYKASQLAGQSINSWMKNILGAAAQEALTSGGSSSSVAPDTLPAEAIGENAEALQVMQICLEATRGVLALIASNELPFPGSTLNLLGTFRRKLVEEIPSIAASATTRVETTAEPEATGKVTRSKAMSAT